MPASVSVSVLRVHLHVLAYGGGLALVCVRLCVRACVRWCASTCVLVLGHMLVRGHDVHVHVHVHERNLWSKEKVRSRLAARSRVAAGKTVPIGRQDCAHRQAKGQTGVARSKLAKG